MQLEHIKVEKNKFKTDGKAALNENIRSMQKVAFVFFAIFCITVWICYEDAMSKSRAILLSTTEEDGDADDENIADSAFLVASSKCRIPNLSPFNSDAKKFYHAEKYTSCRKNELLTYISKTDNTVTLQIDHEIIPSYTNKESVYCCYSNVTRHGTKDEPDDGILMSKCQNFNDSVKITEPHLFVKCYTAKSKKEIYKNAHAAVTISDSVRTKISNFDNTTKPLSVLFVGIDSISRLNFIRALPKTYAFLMHNEWIELKGYNKIGDNTFPNLMAILTGMNNSEAQRKCNPKTVGALDKCSFIWKTFNNYSFVTGYAEDEGSISTFNYKKKGFTNPPTDYYFRPYILAAEKLKIVRVDEMKYCSGPETSGERILNLAKDFAFTFKDYPYFGFFWMNSFSHNKLNSPSRLDYKVRRFVDDLTNGGALKNTIVIFLSDHGLRFGKIRYTRTGWLEERLPYIFIHVPEWFKETYPNKVQNLQINANRLTTPFDVYYTLQEILKISAQNYTVKVSRGCPNCKSLFDVIPKERSCEDASIEQHWCTCTGYGPIDSKDTIVKRAIDYILLEIHNIIQSKRNVTDKCAKYTAKNVISSSISDNSGNRYKNHTYLLIVLETKPQAVFEATVAYTLTNDKPSFQLTGEISRLDSYKSHSKCAGDDAYLERYCYCNNCMNLPILNMFNCS